MPSDFAAMFVVEKRVERSEVGAIERGRERGRNGEMEGGVERWGVGGRMSVCACVGGTWEGVKGL